MLHPERSAAESPPLVALRCTARYHGGMLHYIAGQKFCNTPQGTEVETVYHPGDPIPDFEIWPEHARRRLLKQSYVMLRVPQQLPEGVAPPVAESAADGKKGKKAG